MSQSNENNNVGKLKLIHLLYVIIVAAVGTGIAFGIASNQQATNSKAIEKLEVEKVEKEVFDMHQQQQNMQFKDIKESLKRIENKG